LPDFSISKDPQLAVAVKEILALIKKISPGKSVEVRIPPYGAIQCVAGGNHRRGTPPNIVEMSAQVLMQLRREPKIWAELVASGQITASGAASDLSSVFDQLSQQYPAG
jgi:hypothetical protein